MIKNLPSNAGDVGLIPGRGTKIPHAAGQVSPCATAMELSRLNERTHVWQTTEPTHSESPHATTRERSACHNKEPAPQREDPSCLIEDPACRN